MALDHAPGKSGGNVQRYHRALSKAGNSDVNYVHILRTYIGNHYNISKTASYLHIHRNTLMNYLTRIQELLPYNIGLPENMLKLQIGIHAMYLLDRNI